MTHQPMDIRGAHRLLLLSRHLLATATAASAIASHLHRGNDGRAVTPTSAAESRARDDVSTVAAESVTVATEV